MCCYCSTVTGMASTGVDSTAAPEPRQSDGPPPSLGAPGLPRSREQDDRYDMSGVRKAFILCITKERNGATAELEELRKLLKHLDFQVTECIDPVGKGVLPALERYRDSIEPSACCSFVFVLAHGETGKVFGSDKGKVDLEDIFDRFSNEGCESLQTKPKVFIVQACRGEKRDHGVETSGFRAMAVKPEKLPTVSDTFIVYPSRPGYVAYRNKFEGSYMIKFMMEVFEDHVHQNHLYDLFVKVNCKMVGESYSEEKGKDCKATLVMESTLTKSVYF